MRSLAHIEKIVEVLPIEGADYIELVRVLGWQCVAKKNEFKVGDIVVYHEIDTITPDKPEYEFLKDTKFRIKTRKFRGQISQGLVLPLSILPIGNKFKEGDDVTEVLGLTHYDPESPLHAPEKPKTKFEQVILYLCKFGFLRPILLPLIKKEKGAWPKWFAKTDEERCQNLKWLKTLELFGDKDFYVTEKLDGQSFTAFYVNEKINMLKRGIFGVCSRSQWLKTPDNSNWWKTARKHKLEEVLKKHFEDTGEQILIQGEQCGPGIQDNKLKLKEVELFVFNIVDLSNNHVADADELVAFCNLYGLKHVPILDKAFKLPATIQEMVNYAEGNSVVCKDTIREGVVIRHIKDGVKHLSFKSINNKFLLKNEG